MKITSRINITRFYGMYMYILVFYLTMGISKYSQILYFQQNNGLLNYSISYSAMAISGSLSFLISNNLSTWGLRKISSFFIPIYALGMLLRIIPDNAFIALISGIICGIGASVTLLVIRSWLYFESDRNPELKGAIVSSRYSIMQIGTLLAIISAGWVISKFNSSNLVYINLIVASSIFMGILAVVYKIPNGRIQNKSNKLLVTLPSNHRNGFFLFVIVFVLGLTNALIDPIIPAIFKELGFKINMVTFWTTSLSILTVIVSLIYQNIKFKARPVFAFLLNESLVGIIIICIVLFGQKNIYLFVIAYAVMSIGIAGFFIFKELMEYDMFPREESFVYLGIAQSGFLVGDSLGSPIGTIIFQKYGASFITIIYAVLTIFCGLIYSIYYFKMSIHFKE